MAVSPLTPGSKSSLVDPQALMKIRSLELRARVVVEGFWTGIHRSPYHGFSSEFTEYRQYSPDDDLRFLDWRVYARSDRFFIRKFEDETNVRCYLLVDNSRSMGFGTVGFAKAEYAATLAATLAYFLYLQGDAVGLLTFDEVVRDFLPPRHRKGHLRQIMLSLQAAPAGASTNLAPALKRAVEIIRKRGIVVLVSDFLAPIDRLHNDLLALSASGHEIIVFQVLDPREVAFDFDKPAMFEDMETGVFSFIDPATSRKQYQAGLEAHCAEVGRICERLGATWHRLETSRPLELALFDFLRGMQRRRVRHAGRHASA